MKSLKRNRLAENSQQALEPRIMLASHEAGSAMEMAEGGAATGALALDEGSHTADDGHGHDDLDRPEPEPLTITAAETNSELQSTGSFPDLPLRIDGNDGKVASQEVNANPTDIREFTIGVEIGNSVFNDVYGGDFAAANEAANSLVSNLNETWEQHVGVRFRLSNAEIRRRPEADPFKFEQKGVQNRAAHVELRDYWKNNPGDVGEEPDFIAVHAGGAPSGTALADQRTIFMGGRSQTSWADGVGRHEMGHIWGLPHVGDSDFRYDSQSRKDGDSAGGDVRLFSPMSGKGNNFGRFSSDEVNRMLQAREDFASLGEVVEAGENIRPFANRDIISSSATGGGSLIDALANDFDANGDSLSLSKADTVSYQGGRVAIESGQLRYTPPEDASAGDRDFFHYTASDGNGSADRHGMVEVNLT